MSDVSPVKRNVLARKSVNVKAGARKDKNSSNQSSPKRAKIESSESSVTTGRVASPLRPSGQFTFYKETPEERAQVIQQQTTVAQQRVRDENDFESCKENLDCEETAKTGAAAAKPSRTALRDLSIEEYCGYIEYKGGSSRNQLTLHLAHPTVLPSFVTPPRSAKLRAFFTAKQVVKSKRRCKRAKTTDDICKDRTVRKLDFTIHQDA
ncbi:FACR025Wp [Eremothecium gossypii FDAG1]|nr:FACR025Wp [Eremothecium gossypii FDAG1]